MIEREDAAIWKERAMELRAELLRQIDRSYNPFEPDNQSDDYLRMLALYTRTGGIS